MILATVNFYLLVILFNYDSLISPELLNLTKNEGSFKIAIESYSIEPDNLFPLGVRVTWLLCLSVSVDVIPLFLNCFLLLYFGLRESVPAL